MFVNIILMGAQGSGKGTQAAIIGPKLGLEKVAPGDLFRAAIAEETELGKQIKVIYDRGDLIPDELTNAIVRERLEMIAQRRETGELNGALFDGFPRTAGQAEALDEILAEQQDRVDAVVEIQVPRERLIERLSGRRVCPVCGAVYHLEADPPRIQGQCDNEGATLIQREDDTPEAIRRRLEIYDEQTAPLLNYYDTKGVLTRVDGDQAIESVTEAIMAAVPRKEA